MTDQPHESNTFRMDTRTLSFIVSIVVLFVTIGIAWGTLNQRVGAIEGHLIDHNEEMTEIKRLMYDYNLASQDNRVKLARIEADLAYIRVWIDRLEDRLGVNIQGEVP